MPPRAGCGPGHRFARRHGRAQRRGGHHLAGQPLRRHRRYRFGRAVRRQLAVTARQGVRRTLRPGGSGQAADHPRDRREFSVLRRRRPLHQHVYPPLRARLRGAGGRVHRQRQPDLVRQRDAVRACGQRAQTGWHRRSQQRPRHDLDGESRKQSQQRHQPVVLQPRRQLGEPRRSEWRVHGLRPGARQRHERRRRDRGRAAVRLCVALRQHSAPRCAGGQPQHQSVIRQRASPAGPDGRPVREVSFDRPRGRTSLLGVD